MLRQRSFRPDLQPDALKSVRVRRRPRVVSRRIIIESASNPGDGENPSDMDVLLLNARDMIGASHAKTNNTT